MKEILYDIEEFKRVVDDSKRIHYDAETEYHKPVAAYLTLILEGLSKEGTIIRYEKLKDITFEEVMVDGEHKQGTNAYDDLNGMIKKNVEEWAKKCKEEFKATPGRYEVE